MPTSMFTGGGIGWLAGFGEGIPGGFGRDPKPCTTQSGPSSLTTAPRASTVRRQLMESRLKRGRLRRLSPVAKAAMSRALMVWDLDAGMEMEPETFGASSPGSRPVTVRIIFAD